MPSIPRRSHIYFILDRTANAIKIGYSTNVAARLTDLQTSSSTKLELLGSKPGTRQSEFQLHYRFRHSRLSGEWFTVTPELIEYIEANTTAPTSAPIALARQSVPQKVTPVKTEQVPEQTTAPTPLAIAHIAGGQLFTIVLTYLAFYMWTQVLAVDLARMINMSIGMVGGIGMSLLAYGWLWAVTYRYRNDRAVHKPEQVGDRQQFRRIDAKPVR